MTGEKVFLEGVVRGLLEEGKPGLVKVDSGPGSGKTMALQHRAHVFHGIQELALIDAAKFLDRPTQRKARQAREKLVVWKVLAQLTGKLTDLKR